MSVGLTNNPNLDMAALNAAEEENDPMPDPAVLEALGLNSTASAADAVIAITRLKEARDTALNSAKTPDPGKFVPKATFTEWDPVLLRRIGTNTRVVFRPAAQGDSVENVDTIIATVSGLVTSTEVGALKPGQGSKLKLVWDVRSPKLEHNGVVIWDIDMVNGKRVIGGVDQLAGIRRAIGI